MCESGLTHRANTGRQADLLGQPLEWLLSLIGKREQEPATRSRNVPVTSTSPAPASPTTREAMCTAIPPMSSSGLISISPVRAPTRTSMSTKRVNHRAGIHGAASADCPLKQDIDLSHSRIRDGCHQLFSALRLRDDDVGRGKPMTLSNREHMACGIVGNECGTGLILPDQHP